MPPNARLRIRFPKPGWFLTDVRMEVRLDGNPIYDGSFLSGVDVRLEVPAGDHDLQTVIHIAGLQRSKHYRIDVPAATAPYRDAVELEATLRYSRFWGNFVSKLRVVRV